MADEKESAMAKNVVTIEDTGPCKKKVCIEIPEEVIKKQTDEQYNDLRREAELPGFRKGRAPRRLLEKRFGKETGEQIKLKLIAEASDAAIKDKEVNVLRDPDIDHEKVEMPESGSMKFDFEVEVRPEFDLPELEGIAVDKKKLEVTDDQVEREIEQLLKWSGVWAPRKEGSKVELDDQIIGDLVIKVEGVEEDEKLNNTEVFVRANGYVGQVPVEKLDELLIGAKVGDKKSASVEIPKTYFKEEYRGKKIDVEIEIEDIKHLKPAEMDEAFFARMGIENEDQLREGLHGRLSGQLEMQTRNEMAEQVYKYLLEKTKLELPLDVVADQAASLLQRQYVNLLSKGMAREKVEEQMEPLKASSEEQAKDQLKTLFIMDKVSEKLDIKVGEEEINGHIARLAIQKGQRPEKLREEMGRDGSLAQFGLNVRDEKVVEKLLESAKITDVEPDAKPKKKAKKAVKKTAKKADKAPAKKTVKKTTKKKVEKAEPAEKTVKKTTKKVKPVRKKKTDG